MFFLLGSYRYIQKFIPLCGCVHQLISWLILIFHAITHTCTCVHISQHVLTCLDCSTTLPEVMCLQNLSTVILLSRKVNPIFFPSYQLVVQVLGKGKDFKQLIWCTNRKELKAFIPLNWRARTPCYCLFSIYLSLGSGWVVNLANLKKNVRLKECCTHLLFFVAWGISFITDLIGEVEIWITGV